MVISSDNVDPVWRIRTTGGTIHEPNLDFNALVDISFSTAKTCSRSMVRYLKKVEFLVWQPLSFHRISLFDQVVIPLS